MAELHAALAAQGAIAGPFDLASAPPDREGPPPGDLLRAPLHVHAPAEPADTLHLLGWLAAAGVPQRASLRGENHPLLVLAGPAALPNPEPLATFFEAILVGETVAALGDLARACETSQAAPRGGSLFVGLFGRRGGQGRPSGGGRGPGHPPPA